MIKCILMVAVLGVVGSMVAAEKSDAGIFYRPIAPVRRVAARAVLPPYPVARTVLPPYSVARTVIGGPVIAPVYGPAYGPVVYGTPYGYSPYGYSPYVYGGGVAVTFGY